jgi:hypothetical protein
MSAALAYSDKSVVSHYNDAIVIDGDLSEWDLSSAAVLSEPGQLLRDANQWENGDDLTASLSLAWDDTHIYLALSVLDDTPFMYREGFPPDWADTLVLHFATNPASDPNRTEYEASDFRISLIIDDYYWNTGIDRDMLTDTKGIDTVGDAGDEQVLDGYECAAVQIKTGYVFEAKIPFADFSNDQIPLLVPADGVTIGFDMSMFDLDFPCPGVATARMGWTATLASDTNPSAWGTLTFAK